MHTQAEHPRIEHFMTADISQRSNVDAANELADRYLDAHNSHQLDPIAECLAAEVV
jgi:hypothetical protein